MTTMMFFNAPLWHVIFSISATTGSVLPGHHAYLTPSAYWSANAATMRGSNRVSGKVIQMRLWMKGQFAKVTVFD
jgi:hypothetical protein